MTTADIKDVSMTYSSALEIAKAIDDKRLDFNGMRGTLDNLIDRLNGQWEGTAQREFLTAYNKLKPKLKLISETMERYSREIRMTVKAEQETDATSSTDFRGLDAWFMQGAMIGALDRGKQSNGPSLKGTRKEGMTEKNTTDGTQLNHAQKIDTAPTIADLERSLEDRKNNDFLNRYSSTNVASKDHSGITSYIGKAGSETKGNYGSASVNAYFGKAEADTKLKASIYKGKKEQEFSDGKIDNKQKQSLLNAEASASASVAAVSADAKGNLGNDTLGISGKAEGTLVGAKAEAKGVAAIGEEGVNLYVKGEAIVSAAEGKASGTISILGIDIKATVGGYAGALGVEAKAGIVENKVVAKAGAAALLGVSVGVEIGFNDTGWEQFVDAVTFWK